MCQRENIPIVKIVNFLRVKNIHLVKIMKFLPVKTPQNLPVENFHCPSNFEKSYLRKIIYARAKKQEICRKAFSHVFLGYF